MPLTLQVFEVKAILPTISESLEAHQVAQRGERRLLRADLYLDGVLCNRLVVQWR